MSDSDKPETPANAPADPQTPPANPEAQQTPEAPAAPPATPAAPATPAKPAQPARQDKRKPQPGGGGGMPNRRVRENVTSLDDELRYNSSPKIKDLDAEIAGELEAALGGMSEKEMFGVESSRQARDQAAGQSDHGRKQGKIISIHGPDVFVDVPGGRSQGVLPMLQFSDEPPKIGDMVEVSIEGYDPANGLLLLSRKGAAMTADWNTVAEGMTVEARVLETNKGGLAVDVNGLRGFMPISQIDMYRVENTEQFVNQRLLCLVTEVDPSERNLVVSRRALLEKEREQQREKLWAEIAEGQIRTGIVRSVRDFGAFVDLGGADGLLHVSEMSWKRGQDATALVQPGQTVKVVVLKVDHEGRKISLSAKQLEPGPWDNIQDRYWSGQVVAGKVTRVMDFGAFVELEPGLEGLIHVSELARKKVWRVSDFIKEGQEVQAKILNIDPDQQRISLSLREALPEEAPKSAEPEEEEDADAPAPPPRPRNPNLRGGVGGQTWSLPEQPE